MFWIIIVCFIALIALGVVIYTMPSSAQKTSKKRAKETRAHKAAEESSKIEAAKDWKIIAERWEKQNNNLSGEVERLKMQLKEGERRQESAKAHEKELMDKLSQEKSWREKEQVNLDKAKLLEKDLKVQIIRTEADLEKEHSARIRVEQELQELKLKFDSLQDEKRTATTKAMSLQTTLEQLDKELKELRHQNKELTRKKEDIQWVAKSDYDELKKQLKLVEHELARLKGNPTVL